MYTMPYAIPGCLKQCGGSLTIDYKAWCTCPVLYFILSPDYVRRLPFRDSYWTGVQGFQPTVLPPSDASPLPSRKVFTVPRKVFTVPSRRRFRIGSLLLRVRFFPLVTQCFLSVLFSPFLSLIFFFSCTQTAVQWFLKLREGRQKMFS